MVKKLSAPTRGELIRALKERYMESSKKEKTKILDEFSSVAGYHRKHAVRLLGRHSHLLHPSQQRLGLRTLYSRLARRKGPNVAKIAVARRLLTIIYRVLTERREYIPEIMKQSAA